MKRVSIRNIIDIFYFSHADMVRHFIENDEDTYKNDDTRDYRMTLFAPATEKFMKKCGDLRSHIRGKIRPGVGSALVTLKENEDDTSANYIKWRDEDRNKMSTFYPQIKSRFDLEEAANNQKKKKKVSRIKCILEC